jgi:hypothetical protein
MRSPVARTECRRARLVDAPSRLRFDEAATEGTIAEF